MWYYNVWRARRTLPTLHPPEEHYLVGPAIKMHVSVPQGDQRLQAVVAAVSLASSRRRTRPSSALYRGRYRRGLWKLPSCATTRNADRSLDSTHMHSSLSLSSLLQPMEICKRQSWFACDRERRFPSLATKSRAGAVSSKQDYCCAASAMIASCLQVRTTSCASRICIAVCVPLVSAAAAAAAGAAAVAAGAASHVVADHPQEIISSKPLQTCK